MNTYSDPKCSRCKPLTYFLCACGLETRVRCVEIGCPDAAESTPRPRGDLHEEPMQRYTDHD